MKISVASGKGGTGKTLVATNLAAVGDDPLLVDLDVEEPNDFHFFAGEVVDEQPAYRMLPAIDESLCDRCGKCAEICEFRSIAVLPNKVLVFPELCHACGACILLCPKKAISETDHPIGKIVRMSNGERELIFGELAVGEAMATPLIRQVKSKISSNTNAVIDCPPGISCPAVESVLGSDFCVLVTEPTKFGLHDLDLAVRMLRKIEVQSGVMINKYGIPGIDIESYCRDNSLRIIGRIPFDRKIAEKYANGELVTDERKYLPFFESILDNIKEAMGAT